MMKKYLLINLIALSPLLTHADWPRFLGPDAKASINNNDIPLTWSSSENLAWSIDLPGAGNSSPVVFGNDLFITCYSGYGLDRRTPGNPEKLVRHLLRINAKTGKIIWNRIVPTAESEDVYSGYITEHGYASNTPVTDGKHVFVNHGKSGVYAYDLAGNERWNKSIGSQSSTKRWGSAASPILYKNMVIVNASEESNALYAFDKITGNEVWKSEASKLYLAYGTPRIIRLPDGRDELLLAVPTEVWGMNPDTGKLRWLCESPFGGNISPSVVYGDGVCFAYGGFPKKGSIAVKVGGQRDVTETRLWVSDRTPYVSTPVYHDGKLYWVTRDGFAECQDAKTGDTIYKARLESEVSAPRFYASPILINNHIVMTSRNAGTFVYKTGDTFIQTSQNLLDDDSEFNGTPAITKNMIYLRSNKKLYAIGK